VGMPSGRTGTSSGGSGSRTVNAGRSPTGPEPNFEPGSSADTGAADGSSGLIGIGSGGYSRGIGSFGSAVFGAGGGIGPPNFDPPGSGPASGVGRGAGGGCGRGCGATGAAGPSLGAGTRTRPAPPGCPRDPTVP